MSDNIPVDDTLVSVVITIYNQRDLVSSAVDSVLAQSHRNLDILVIDDGSQDGTGTELASRYGRRIRYFFQENRGQGAARNVGIREARGRYIQFLDGDDKLLPEKIARCVARLQGQVNYQAAYCHYACFGNTEAHGDLATDLPTLHRQRYRSGYLWPHLLRGNFLLNHTPLVRLDLVRQVGGFDENRAISGCEDFDLWLRLSHAGCRFLLVDEVLALYRRCQGSATTNHDAQCRRTIRVLEKISSYAPRLSAADQDALGWYLSRLHLRLGLNHWRRHYWIRGLADLVAAMRYDPRGLSQSLRRAAANRGLHRQRRSTSATAHLAPGR